MQSYREYIAGWFSASRASIPETCGIDPRLRDSAVSGTPLEHQNELRAPSAHHAAYYLDAAIAARTVPGRFIIISYYAVNIN